MDFVVAVSESERARGELNPATARAAYAGLANWGAVILRGVFATETIDRLRDEFAAQFGGLDLAGMKALADQPPPTAVTEVGLARFEIVLRMEGAFGPKIYANPTILKVLAPLMGGDMRLSGFTAVASFPGADAQRMHRDHAHLFSERGIGTQLPVYAVNVAVPLIDVDEQTGPTALWPGSHRWPDGVQPPPNSMAVLPFQRGDAILIDYRTAHAGMPNQSAVARPILYMVYARPWFFDDVNHPGRSPLNMDLVEFDALPDETKPLLQRAYAQAMRARFLAGQA